MIAETAFRAARLRTRGDRAARDLATALAVLRLGYTARQVQAAWVRVEPAMREAVAYMQTIIAKARALLRRESGPSLGKAPPRP